MKPRKLETWMVGFVAGLVVAIALGAGASRLHLPGRTSNPVQLQPKVKSVRAFPLFAQQWAEVVDAQDCIAS